MLNLLDLCALHEIPDHQARGYTVASTGQDTELFIVREGENIYGYLNRCPHTGVNLNWQPEQFMDTTGQFIQCSNHGAQFRIHDGYCIWGSCLGKSLTPISLTLEHGRVKIRT